MTLHQLELRSASCDYAGGCFRLNDKGLSFIGSDNDGNQLPPRWICSPIKVIAKTQEARKTDVIMLILIISQRSLDAAQRNQGFHSPNPLIVSNLESAQFLGNRPIRK